MRQEALEVLKRTMRRRHSIHRRSATSTTRSSGHRPEHGHQLDGISCDPADHVVSRKRQRQPTRSLVETPKGFSDIRYMTGIGGRPFQEIFRTRRLRAADGGRKTRDDLPAAPAAPAAPYSVRTSQGGHRGAA
jgi:hypothetical protein